MTQSDKPSLKTKLENLAGSLLLLSFGFAMLAYLIAIDRPEWFSLRPASGTAAAMSNAGHAPASTSASAGQSTADAAGDRMARMRAETGQATN